MSQAGTDELILRVGAVKRHGNTIFSKLGVTSRNKATDPALAIGLVRL